MRFVLDPLSPTGVSKETEKPGYRPYFAGGPGKPSLVDRVNGKTGDVQLNLDDLTDVVLGTPADNQALAYDSATEKFIPQSIASLAGGDVTGPASATDNAIARFDGTTGKLIEDSGVLISDLQYEVYYTVGTTNADYITDGTADDVQLQQALDAASAAGGGTVFVKEGTYTIAAKVTLPSHVTLRFDNGAKVIKTDTDAIGFENSDTTGGNTRIVIEGGEFDSAFTPSAKNSMEGFINFNKVTYSRISNVYIHNTDNDGIKLTNSDMNTIENPRIENVSGDLIFISRGAGTSFGNVIKNIQGFNSWDDGIDLQGDYCQIIGGKIHTTGEDGIYINTNAIGCRVYGVEVTGVASGFNGVNVSSSAGANNIITGVNVHDCTGVNGINVGADNTTVTASQSVNNNRGILEGADADGCSYSGNILSGNATSNATYNGTNRISWANSNATNFVTTKAGFGTAPTLDSQINTYQNDTQTGNSVGAKIEQAGTGDAVLQFQLTGVRRWGMGIDNSDSDKFKIAANSDIGSTPLFSLGVTGAADFVSSVTIDRDASSGSSISGVVIDVDNASTGGAIGLDISGVTATSGTVIGQRIALPSGGTANYALQLSDTTGVAAGGITFASDVQLYRSAANVLKLDDQFSIAQANNASALVVAKTGSGAGDAQTITNDGTGVSLRVTTNTNNTGVILDSAATGAAGVLVRNSSAARSGQGTASLMVVQNSDTTNTGHAMHIQQKAGGTALGIDIDNVGLTFDLDQDVTNKNFTTGAYRIVATSVVNDAATYTKTGSIVQIVSNVTETSGSITDSAIVLDVQQTHADASGNLATLRNDGTGKGVLIDNNGNANALEVDHDGNSASKIWGAAVTVDNAGAGGVGGIDFSGMTTDEALIKATADAITTPGTVSHQIPIDIGGTTFYLVAYTHGS